MALRSLTILRAPLSTLLGLLFLACLAACAGVERSRDYDIALRRGSLSEWEAFQRKYPDAPLPPEVLRRMEQQRAKEDAESEEKSRRALQAREFDARRQAEQNTALRCGDASASSPSVAARNFVAGMPLQHPAGEIRVRQTSAAASLLIGGRRMFSALPGDHLVVIELLGEFSDDFKSTIGNYMVLENADGQSVVAPQLQLEFTPGKLELSRSPQSMLLLNQILEPVDGDRVKTAAVHRGWIAIGAVKSSTATVFLRLPCIADRVRLP